LSNQTGSKKECAVATEKTSLSAAEKSAIADRAKELKREKTRASGEADMREKIAQMDPAEQKIANRLHELITATAPHLTPTTWYGMPAWKVEGKTICFFQAASKFGSRYSTFGFDEHARLDSGEMWATSFALIELTEVVERKIVAMVKKAAK
jgi:uncharacterized protein YdhG (YjbR/CyaY superfamily)